MNIIFEGVNILLASKLDIKVIIPTHKFNIKKMNSTFMEIYTG